MQPAEGIKFIHTAIDVEVRELESDAAVAETPDALGAYGARFERFAFIVKGHNDGEEDALFPELEQRAPRVAAAYLFDHRDEADLFGAIRVQLTTAKSAGAATRAGELAKLRRHAIALTEHVCTHVRKENELVVPLIVELFSPAEQGAHIGRMMARFPPEAMVTVMPWLVSKLGEDDRVTYVGMLQRALPPERFPVACGWIRGGVGDSVWGELARGIPGLPSS